MVRSLGQGEARLLLQLRLGAVLEAQRPSTMSRSWPGAFNAPTGLKGDCHIFVEDKGDYYTIDDALPQFQRSTPSIKVADD